MTAPKWEALSACNDHPADLWFPEKASGQDNHGAAAKRICATCPVITDCLTAALDRNETHGIWGGAGGDWLRDLGRAWRARTADPEGWQTLLELHLGKLDGNVVAIRNRNGPNATCGLRSTYNKGCRCKACKWAAADDVEDQKTRRTA